MARLLDVTSKSIQRWETRNALPSSERVRGLAAQLAEIAELGTTVYTPEGFAACMATPLRAVTNAQALRVPSAAFLDDLERWNLVLSLEKLPEDVTSYITSVEEEAPLRWGRRGRGSL